ncbi:MAG: SpoIIE family protein phosphatase [Clostridia bacterium]
MDNRDIKPIVILEKTKKALNNINRKKPMIKITVFEGFFFLISLLCGRATLFSSLHPFGGAFFAAAFSDKYGLIYLLGAILGQLSSKAPLVDLGKYMFAMTSFALITDKLPKASKDNSLIRGGIFAFSLALSGFCFLVTQSTLTLLYDSFNLIVECAAAFCAVVAFHKAIPIIRQMKLSYTFSSIEEISLVSLLGCALWGMKDISQIGIINLSDIICILIVLIFSVRLGSARGAVAGLTMGLVSALGKGIVDTSCVSYAFSGLAAGLAGGYGAIPGCSAFIFSNALITAFANGSTEVLINIYDIFSACIIYSLIPERLLLRLTSFGARDEKLRCAEDERCYSNFVLLNAQKVTSSLSLRMDKLEAKRTKEGEAELKFYERVARRACMGCGMKRLCWGRDLSKTCHSLNNALTEYNKTGIFQSELLPENCLRPRELKDAFMHLTDIYRSDVIWANKIQEVREASKNQMAAFSEILTGAVRALSESRSFDRALADDITRKLEKENIKCSNVVVMRDEESDPTVMLHLSGCGGFALCENGVCDIISASCGRTMIRSGKRDCKNCNIKYVVSPPVKMNFAVSKKSRDKKKLSGDCAEYRIINKNITAAVLCDGMGYGEKAAMEAKGASEMLLDLIEAGISGEDAVKIVNSLLIPTGEVTFSATDLCIYNSRDMTAKIIKCGSAASFTKSGDRVDALYSKTMPLGSCIPSGTETFTLSAREGDMIIMISDGVLESAAEGALKDAWLIRELEQFHGSDIARLSDLIVEKAMEKCGKNPRDDITVLTAVIE